MTEYEALLLDPRWQRRRCEVLIRDDFTCQYCDETTKTLHVHHTVYIAGRMPWEYPVGDEWPRALETTCEDCHKWLTEIQKIGKEMVRLADRIKEKPHLWRLFEQHPEWKS